MPHLIGLQLHSDGISVAAMRPDQTIVLRPVDDMASVIQRANAQRWKWSLGVEGREAAAVAAARDLFVGLQHAMGDDHILAGVAVPASWGDRARRDLLLAMEDTTVETMRLVRNTSALAIAASLGDPTLSGLCAVAHVGTHQLEFALADISPATIRVRARQSVAGLDGSNVGFDSLVQLINEVAHYTAHQAGVAASLVRRFVCTGRRCADPALADALGGVWGIPAQVAPAGTIALGAAHVAVGLTGMVPPWNLLDDLDEPPLAALRGSPRRRPTRVPAPAPAPAPVVEPIEIPVLLVEEVPIVETYRPTAPPPERIDLLETIVDRPESSVRYTTQPPPTAPVGRSSGSHPRVEGSRISDHPSFAPPTGRIADIPPTGSFVGLPTLDSIRALQLLHPVEPEGLARPSLATLLDQFVFLRAHTGTLTLRHRTEEVVLHIERGGICLTTPERARALRPFDWPDGTFTWKLEKLPWQLQKSRTPLTAFVVAGLRIRLRSFDDAVFTQAHLTKLRLAPSVIDDRRSRLARLGLPEAEERAVDYVLDGTRSFEKMLAEGYIGRTTMHRLVVLLDLYGILHWSQPSMAASENPVEVMARLLSRIENANHFVALGVHWSAPTDEIREAWEKMQSTYGLGGSWQRHDPGLAARILQRGAAAWAVLRNDVTRVKHRRDAYPGMDEQLLAPLVEARAKALEMRGETSEAQRMMRLRGEFQVAETEHEPPKRKS
ncbi:MAG: hypothetical protein EPO40_11430 [Myxococcaceae bacterium]|nr:MAG: hypothetical protein EPO40_11430 [Myxococcaceae bacterium]